MKKAIIFNNNFKNWKKFKFYTTAELLYYNFIAKL